MGNTKWRISLKVWLLTSVCLIGLIPVKRPTSLASAQLGEKRDQFGNYANGESKIKFAAYNVTAKYKTSHATEMLVGEGMIGFYNMAGSLARSFFSVDGYPYGMIKELTKISSGTFDATRFFAMTSPAFRFFVVMGNILAIFFLILALFLPCCLCCSNCCGRYKRKPPTVLRVLMCGFGLLVFEVLSAVCIAAAYTTSIHITTATSLMLTSITNALYDVETFLNHSSNEVLFIFDKAEFAKDVFYRDLDNTGYLLGSDIKRLICAKTGTDVLMVDLQKINNGVENASRVLDSIQTKLDRAETTVTEINGELRTVVQNCNNAHGNQCPSLYYVQFTKPDLVQPKGTVTDRVQANIVEIVEQQLTNIDTLPNRTQRLAKPQVDELKSNLQGQIDILKDFKTVVVSVKNKSMRAVNADTYAGAIGTVKDHLMEYQDRGSKSTMTLLVPQSLACFLIFLGALVVILIYVTKARAFQVGNEPASICSTRIGGWIMYIGIILHVLFAWLWMLLAVFLFIIGSPLDSVVCALIDDPNYVILDKLVEEYDVLGSHENGTYMADNLLPIPESKTTFGSLLRDCQMDKSLFSAVEMEKHPWANFSYDVDFLDRVNISEIISSIDVDVRNVTIMTPEVRNYFDGLIGLTTQIPFTQLNSFNSDLLKDQRRQLMEAINAMASLGSGYTPSTQVFQEKFDTAEDLLGQIDSEVDILETVTNDVATKARDASAKMEEADRRFWPSVPSSLTEASNNFCNRLSSIVESFIDEAKQNVFFDYAKCKPLYNIFKETLGYGICGKMANIVNGSWMALFWMTIFMFLASLGATDLHRLIPKPLSGAELEAFELASKANTTSDYGSPPPLPLPASNSATDSKPTSKPEPEPTPKSISKTGSNASAELVSSAGDQDTKEESELSQFSSSRSLDSSTQMVSLDGGSSAASQSVDELQASSPVSLHKTISETDPSQDEQNESKT